MIQNQSASFSNRQERERQRERERSLVYFFFKTMMQKAILNIYKPNMIDTNRSYTLENSNYKVI